MNFTSDNAGGVHPRIMAALAAANDGHVPAYGGDRITRAAQALRVPKTTLADKVRKYGLQSVSSPAQ